MILKETIVENKINERQSVIREIPIIINQLKEIGFFATLM